MSLNGLDHVQVTEAYTAALAEAGGWLLLKYASRDSVEILTRGTGGTAEARGAIAAYDQTSPLYGFLLYRRRKVLIKYVPDGTSRLIQARVAVHFTTVTEKFTPHDTTLSITTADELNDAALAAACSVLMRSRSCNKAQRCEGRRLDGITEDVEDGQSPSGESPSTVRPSALRVDTATTTDSVQEEPSMEEADEPTLTKELPKEKVEETPVASPINAPEANDHPELERSTTAPNTDSYKNYDSLFEDGPDPRSSSQTARPDYSDLYAEIYAKYNKPKVKLGPRPKQSLDLNRPSASDSARAVSSLPAGLRSSNRKPPQQPAAKRPKSRDSSQLPSIAIPPPPPIPTSHDMPVSPMYFPRSPASVRSLPLHTYGGSKITPEKQRLMKAMELRKKQMEAKKEKDRLRAEAVAKAESEDTTAGAEQDAAKSETEQLNARTSHAAKEQEVEEVEATEEDTGAGVEESTVISETIEPTAILESNEATSSNATSADEPNQLIEKEETSLQPPVPDNAEDTESTPTREEQEIGMTHTQAEADDVHSAISASSPISAQTQGSSGAPSTRPSSISEDESHPSKEAEAGAALTAHLQIQGLIVEDEKDSAESTPTVVPESLSPVTAVEVPEKEVETHPPISPETNPDAVSTKKKNRESVILEMPDDLDEARARRKAKRASMLLPLSSESLHETGKRSSDPETLNSLTGQDSTSAEHKDVRRVVESSHVSAENSEADYLSDDSFMDELQSAKVEEARPISVAKSPIRSYFPRKSQVDDPVPPIPQRSASQQHLRPIRAGADQPAPRKLSGPWLTQPNSDNVVVAKKINVSSGISQRIKALAEKSNRDSIVSLSPISPEGSSTLAQRKSSFFTTTPESTSPNGKPINRTSRASFINVSGSTTPEQKPPVLDFAAPAPAPAKSRTIYNVQTESEQPESVEVTAHIVRDPQPQRPVLTMPTGTTPLELHESSIVIDHQKSARPLTSSSRNSPIKTEPTSPRPPSSSQSVDPSPTLARSSSESSWRTFGRRMSEPKISRSPSTTTSPIDSSEEKPAKKEKKDSKTSKLFKRMSSISSMTRKNSAATISEDLQSLRLPSVREPPSPTLLGDLNIQFPDTLLWKRRWAEIDASGNLVLSLSKANDSKGMTKRYNLTEFRAPYAPDLDRQELPNSVILDFVDGRTLQCACETYAGQAHLLKLLQDTRSEWLAYNEGQ